MNKFAKLFETKSGQILILLEEGGDYFPEINILFKPEGYGICKTCIAEFKYTAEPWKRAETAFKSITEEIANELVDKLILRLRMRSMIGNRVEMAAIIGEDGKVYSLPRPNRHHNIIWYLAKDLKHSTPISGEQGFVLTDGTFIDRKAAKLHAIANNQLLETASKSSLLFSEDMW